MKQINSFLKYIFFLLILSFIFCTPKEKPSKAEEYGWKLSMKSYTFRLFSGIEAIEKTKELGVKYIEMSSNQRVGGDIGDDKFNYKLTQDKRKKIKEFARSKGVKIVSTSMGTPKAEEWKDIFAFAKDMGLEYITAEPAAEDWSLVEDLVKKYKIKVACHNHPSEKSYWKPEILLQYIQNRSKLLGACCDIGHYKRMNLDPIVCLKKLEDRIVSFDFKDIKINNSSTDFEDVIWGQGVLDINGILNELKNQNFRGYFTIEYETNWENNIPDIKKSIEYFNMISSQILNTPN